MRALPTVFVLLLSCAAAAQKANFSYLDQRLPYRNPTPAWLTNLDLPRIGQAFRVQGSSPWFADIFNNGSYLLATGTRNPDLQFDALGGFLFTNADLVVLRFPPSSGARSTLSFAVPNSTQLLGQSFYQQILGVIRRSGRVSLSLSRGGHGVIGK